MNIIPIPPQGSIVLPGVSIGCLLDGRVHKIAIGHDASIGPEAAILTLGHDPNSPVFADRTAMRTTFVSVGTGRSRMRCANAIRWSDIGSWDAVFDRPPDAGLH